MISPLAYVDSKAVIGNNVTIHPFAYIDKDVVIGDNCVIYPYASVLAGTVMGKNNRVACLIIRCCNSVFIIIISLPRQMYRKL